MKNRLMLLEDRLILSKRAIIESAIAIEKQEFSIEHTRHRSYHFGATGRLSYVSAIAPKERRLDIPHINKKGGCTSALFTTIFLKMLSKKVYQRQLRSLLNRNLLP